MKLKNLLNGLNILYAPSNKNIDILNIANSTKDVTEGTLFFCLKGQKVDGHTLKKEAQNLGAICFIVEKYDECFNGMQIVVDDARASLSIVCANFFKHKTSLKIIGITGTNGKTTTTHMIANILECANKKVGIIGTEGVKYNGDVIKFNMTTPDPIELFKTLKHMSEQQIEYVVMEVSAHAIYLNKIHALKFLAKGLTNITEDHLDFFENMENYSKTKLNFINQSNCKKVVNIDDERGYKLSLKNKDVYTYSLISDADAVAFGLSDDCSEYKISLFNKELSFNTNTIARYNVENALCAVLIAKLIGIKEKCIINGINTFKSVDGRLNVYKKQDKTVIIDFAHTPDALKKVLTNVRPFVKNKLICVFGCGGNRDSTKRKHMGEVASMLADLVIITNDNPRYEEPMQIAKDIEKGIKTSNYEIILNRKKAVEKAVKQMQDGDVLVLCGKGTENYIEINGEKQPYLDKNEVLKWGFKEQ